MDAGEAWPAVAVRYVHRQQRHTRLTMLTLAKNTHLHLIRSFRKCLQVHSIKEFEYNFSRRKQKIRNMQTTNAYGVAKTEYLLWLRAPQVLY